MPMPFAPPSLPHITPRRAIDDVLAFVATLVTGLTLIAVDHASPADLVAYGSGFAVIYAAWKRGDRPN